MTTRAEDAIEALLEQAPPRALPPAGDERLVRAAVMGEWQALTTRRRNRRRVGQFALAATVLLALAVGFDALRSSVTAGPEVATIVASQGPVYRLGEGGELRSMASFERIEAGQTIVTGNAAGIGIAWAAGGSLRVAADTRLEFLDADTVYLHSGRIYYDSSPYAWSAAIGPDSAADFVIETPQGSVRHVGTQFMTFVDAATLAVSVRTGEVAIAGHYHDAVAMAGQQLTVSGSGRPSIVNIPVHGEAWSWTEQSVAGADVDGRTMQEFLAWVGHETGLRVEFASEAARERAARTRLRGTVDETPTEALRLRMLTSSLRADIEDGRIIVSLADGGSAP